MDSQSTALRPCPICGGVDGSVASSRFPHFRSCRACGGYFLPAGAPPPEYAESYFAAEKPTGGFLLQLFRMLRVRMIHALLGDIARPRVLDYGAGDGALVAELRGRGIDTLGFDLSPAAVARAAKRGIPVSREVPAGPFDLVMLWHSLEHADDPAAVLESLRPHLRDQAKLLIAVPNAASWEAKLAGERWFHYDFPFHRLHFTPQAISALLGRAGFRVVTIDYFTPEYTVSGLVQTALNFFLPKNALYTAVTGRRGSASATLLTSSLALAALLSPLLIPFYLLQLLTRRTGAMVVVAKRV